MRKGAEPRRGLQPLLRIRHTDPRYPPLLRTLEDRPSDLYARGDPTLLDATAVAVVGARHATGLGLQMGERLGAGLAAAGIVVVSGCAIGIDAAAHRGALDARGATVAVLAGGLDVAVPPSNRSLARRILAEGGCLASEHPDGVPPARWSFPRRNRIIAGLARVVVVVEAAARSGALITARLALAAGREVMVVPGHPLQPEYAGSNGLFADGAHPVIRAEDVLGELAGLPRLDPLPARDAAAPPPPAGGLRSDLHAALDDVPRSAEELAAATGASLAAVLAALTELELLGLARARPGCRYAKPAPPSPP